MAENGSVTPAFYVVPVLCLALFALERAFPLRVPKRPLRGRLVTNLCVGAIALLIVAIVVRPVAIAVLEEVTEHSFGLIPQLAMPPVAQWIAGFLLLDLSFYYWHRANHAWPFLWRFHNAHHIDPDLDVSTSFRFHFVEIGLSAGFRAVQIALIGGSPLMFIAYELFFQANTLFQHSNVRVPIGVERRLCFVLVTPRMHGIHHSRVRAENNANWSSVFSWWDRLHGSLRLDIPQAAIDIGIAGYSRSDDNRPVNVLAIPFRRQRDYWRDESGAIAVRTVEPRGQDARVMAE